MDFEEKIDAMRMTLELAMHDIEAQRANIAAMGVKLDFVGEKLDFVGEKLEVVVEKIDTLRIASEHQYEVSQVLLKATENLVVTANSHQADIESLKKISGELVRTAEIHDRRIIGLEGRI